MLPCPTLISVTEFSLMRPFLPALLLLLISVSVHAAEPAYHVTRREVLPGDVRWDYLSYDARTKRLFLTRGDHVEVYDTTLGHVIGEIPETPGVHGVALAPDLDKGFTSNGRSNTVTIFELSSLRVLGTLPTERNPDAIAYDPFTRRVFAANGKSGNLTVIDAVNDKVLATVSIGGKLEFEAVDGKGHLYVNIEDLNALAVVDTAALSVLARHDLSASCREPAGLSIDAAGERLFVGCRNQVMAVVSGVTGQILAVVPIGKGSDATAYDRDLHLAFSSNGDGTLTVISTDSYTVLQTLVTQPNARTLALDAVGHHIYTVAAERDEPGTSSTRPHLKPGTFTLITVSR